MDDGRVSYKEAVEAIRQFGYLGIERNEDVVILYADDIPYASVKNTNYPLRTWIMNVMTGSLWRIAGQLMMLFGTLITAFVH